MNAKIEGREETIEKLTEETEKQEKTINGIDKKVNSTITKQSALSEGHKNGISKLDTKIENLDCRPGK